MRLSAFLAKIEEIKPPQVKLKDTYKII